MSQDIQDIINGDLDLYEFLEINPVDSHSVIRRQYRRKALIYHPDKLGDSTKFNLLNIVYNILSDEALRRQYDTIRTAKLQRSLQQHQLDELTKKFQSELLQSESKLSSTKREANIDQLREDGIKKRRIHEQQFVPTKNPHYVPFLALDCPNYIHLSATNSHTVEVKWKHRPELSDYFDETVLHQIMQIFGAIESIKFAGHKPSSRYDSAVVEYALLPALEKACSHDFRKSASLWDGTPVRKVASLIRECKEVNNINNIVEKILTKYDEKREGIDS